MNNLTAVGAYMSSIQQSYAKIQTAINDLRVRIDVIERSQNTGSSEITSAISSDSLNQLKTDIETQLRSEVQKLQEQMTLLQQRVDNMDVEIASRIDTYVKSSTDIDEKIKNAINVVLEGLAAATSSEVSVVPPVTEAVEAAPVKKVARKKTT